MNLWRRAAAILGLAIFLLNDGNCFNLLLADQKTKDCCAQGKCHKAGNSDPCCQTPSPSAIKYFQPESKASVDMLHVIVAPVAQEAVTSPDYPTLEAGNLPFGAPLRSPPDPHSRVPLPLLI